MLLMLLYSWDTCLFTFGRGATPIDVVPQSRDNIAQILYVVIHPFNSMKSILINTSFIWHHGGQILKPAAAMCLPYLQAYGAPNGVSEYNTSISLGSAHVSNQVNKESLRSDVSSMWGALFRLSTRGGATSNWIKVSGGEPDALCYKRVQEAGSPPSREGIHIFTPGCRGPSQDGILVNQNAS